MLYRNREHVELTAVEQAYLNAGSVNARRDPLSFAEWRSLFRNRTMWGMMLDSVASTTLRGCIWPGFTVTCKQPITRI